MDYKLKELIRKRIYKRLKKELRLPPYEKLWKKKK